MSKEPVTISFENPVLRSDLKHKLHSLLCKKTKITPSVAWSVGVYDADVTGRYFISKKGDGQQLQHLTRKYARATKSYGYAFGKCSTDHYWLINVPSPFSYDSFVKQADFCDQTTTLFAPNKKHQPVTVNANKFKTKQDGVLGVYCLRDDVKKTFFLKPINNGPDKSLPEQAALNTKSFSQKDFLLWLNKIRKKLQLYPVKNHSLPPELTSKLQKMDVQHDLKALKKMQKALSLQKLVFIGENRVLGRTPQELLWQLWYSPLHRSLLLDKRVKYFHFDLKQTDQMQRLFLIGLRSSLR